MKARLESLHHAMLIGFGLMLGLFEGPAEILCVGLLLTTAATGRFRALKLAHPILLGLLLWWLAGVPGLLSTEAPVSSQGYLRPLHALALLAGGFALRDVPARVLAGMAWAFGGAITLNGAYGLLQVWIGALPLDDLLNFNKGSPQIFVPGSRTERCASGLFYNRLRLAHMGAMGLSLFLVLATSKNRRVVRVLSSLGLVVLGAAVLFTYARTVLVAWTVGCGLLVLVLSRPRRAALVVAAPAVLGAVVAPTEFGRRIIERIRDDLPIRGRIFSMGTEIWAGHPWFGTGHGTYAQHARPLLRPTWSRNWTSSAHNLYLHVLAETGVVGLLGFLVVVGYSVVRLLRRVRAEVSARRPQARLRRIALVVVLTVLTLGLLHQPLHHTSVSIGFWFAVGLGGLDPAESGLGDDARA